MSRAKKVFLIILGLGVGFGGVIGIINLIAPDAASITLNDQNVEGMTAFWTSLLSGGIPGAIFGLIGAGITALFTRKNKSD